MTDRDRQDIFDDAIYNAGLTAQGCWENLDDYTQDAIKRLFTYAYRAGVAGEYDQFDRAGVAANPDAKREPATAEQVGEAYEASHDNGLFTLRDPVLIFFDAWRAAERWHGITKEGK